MIHYFAQNEVSGKRDCFFDITLNRDDVSQLLFLIVRRMHNDVEVTADTSVIEERQKRVVVRYASCRLYVSLGVDGRVGGDRGPSTQPHPGHRRNESSIFATVSESAEFFAPYQFCDRFVRR